MTYFWGNRPLNVTMDALQQPSSLVWRKRRHMVQEIVNMWRADEGWWRGEERLWREYVLLRTDTNLLLLLYHDLRSGCWYMHREYD